MPMKLSTITSSIDSALETVIEREGLIKTLPIDGTVSVELFASIKQISIKTAGRVFLGNLDSKLIHQLGSKIWKNLDRESTIELWKEHINSGLAHRLERALSRSGTVLRYAESGAVCNIYGVTSPHFIEMNQRVFRNTLIESLSPIGITPNGKIFKTPFNEVVEEFSVPGQEGQVGLTCKVVYGLNNGYSSYRLNWGRIVLVCTNGLTAFRNAGRDRWIHTEQVNIRDFAIRSVESAYSHLSDVERQISAARERTINYSLLDQFMTRLALANATKERVSARLNHELRDTGPNEWSVGQALTFLGEHEKAIAPRVRDNLPRLGSSLLEKSLEQVVSAPPTLTSAGFYDILR
jgi:hypothetical protein